MKLLNNRFLPIILSAVLVLIFFWQFFFKGLLPIPSDTIVGLYHPYRDFYAKDYPRGIPYKNFLTTDPVRQQYPWKFISIEQIKKGQLPLWNPYSFAGTPLLANFQSSVFYPLNILFFFLPFNSAWTLLIILEVFLGSLFMFFYLSNLKLSGWSSILGALIFSLSGFSVAWLEWGTVIHTLLWLPLILFSVDKLVDLEVKKKNIWLLTLAFSLILSFFAGHLQIFFYVSAVSLIYFITRWIQNGKGKKILKFALFALGVFILVTSIQWIPTLQFINESARSVDQNWQKIGWFIPWQNLLQFVVPDFFGNPATLNYWGIFNYGEFIGYVGVMPLMLSLYAIFLKRDKNVIFFGSLFLLALVFALPTPLAKLPYILNLPFVSTSQPTRLISVADFSLAVLSALGLELFLKKKRKIIYPFGLLLVTYLIIWVFVYTSNSFQIRENLAVIKSNLILPTLTLGMVALIVFLSSLKMSKKISAILVISLIFLTAFDLFRFAWKFTPFTKSGYLFPNTKILNFLESEKSPFRIMTTDSRIFSPNFSDVYKIQSTDGYDPLYLRRYGELIAANERDKPDISPPFGFDRIITPHNFDSKIIDLLGVKYILSLTDISNKSYEKVLVEGETRVYKNNNAFPRVFFVKNTILAKDKNESINLLYSNKENLNKLAVVEGFRNHSWSDGKVQVLNYSENKIILKTENMGDGFLVLTDSFYPSWHVRIDGKESIIFRSDFNFRGVIIPRGDHIVEFYITLF